MTREAFRELVKKGPVLLDGATGTNLQKAGMPVGVCPEQWILENSEVLIDLQKRYVEAGTDILFAPTFTASRIKLKEYGLEDHLEEMNRKLVALSKEAAKGTNALVAGDLTMTGEQLYPLGDLMFEDLVDVYKEQAKIIAEAGADLFVVETMMSLQECRAAVLAIREVCDLPVMVSLTYNEDGRTLYGTDPVTAVVVMQSLGADAVGMNCSTGPEAMLEPIAKMAEYATIPLLAKPNAGMPELIDGQTVFNVEPEEFAEVGKKLVEEGAAIIGGCCGTTPEHIRALKEAVKGIPVKAPLQTKRRMLTSERKSVEITLDGRFMVIGERINPTGKKKLQAELKEGSLNLVRTMALEQEENGASILDINMGMNAIDQKEMMLRTNYEVTSTVDCPLCIDSSHVDIIEAALRIYPGRALINSISLEKEKFETEYGVSGMVKERKAKYKDLHTKNNIAGTCLCITALIPLFVGAIIDVDNDLFLIIMLSFSFIIAGIGVICFIKTGIIWASYEKLLQEGEYSKENKEKPSFSSAIYTAYWVIVTAVYLGYSLPSNNWGQSWIIWVVAGVMFPAIVAITNAFDKKSK